MFVTTRYTFYMNKFLFITFFISSLFMQGQEVYEYYGGVKLNDTSIISYKITFSEINGVINGFSVTDLQGPHETKSLIKGIYNSEDKVISFSEHDIVYTKSEYSEDMFCFIHFTSERFILGKSKSMDGYFEGKYEDETKCLDGELLLLEMEKIRNKARKITKKIERSKRIADSIKVRANPTRLLDTLNMNVLRKEEKMNVFVKGNSLEMILFDGGKEDGDEVDIWVDDQLVLEKYQIINNQYRLAIPLSQKTVVKIKARNNGEIKPNTMSVIFKYDGRVVEALSNLNEGEITEIVFLKK